jgi:hypothetical protein
VERDPTGQLAGIRRATGQDGVGSAEPDARVVKARPVATLRGKDAVLVPVVGLGLAREGESWDALVAGVGAAVVRGLFVAVDELAVQGAHLVPDEDQVSRAGELRRDDERCDDRW